MRNIIAIGFALCGALPIMPAWAQPELPALKVERNVIYGMYSGLALLMDIYHPANPNGYGIVHISGSGWKRPLDYDAKRITQSGHVEIEGGALVKAGYIHCPAPTDSSWTGRPQILARLQNGEYNCPVFLIAQLRNLM